MTTTFQEKPVATVLHWTTFETHLWFFALIIICEKSQRKGHNFNIGNLFSEFRFEIKKRTFTAILLQLLGSILNNVWGFKCLEFVLNQVHFIVHVLRDTFTNFILYSLGEGDNLIFSVIFFGGGETLFF